MLPNAITLSLFAALLLNGLDGLLGTAEIWVDRGLPSGLLRRRRRGRRAWGKLEHVRRLVHLRWRLRPILL